METVKIAIVGSRDITNYAMLEKILNSVIRDKSRVCIVSGGARGVDALAKRYAKMNGTKYKEFPANWDLYGKKAGAIRNSQIVEYSDAVIAFWDGKSKGTKDTINKTVKAGKLFKIYDQSGELRNITWRA